MVRGIPSKLCVDLCATTTNFKIGNERHFVYPQEIMLEWLVALVVALLAIASIQGTREYLENPPDDTVKIPDSLQKLLDVYASSYTNYRATGMDAYRNAYQMTEVQINTMLRDIADTVDERKKHIDEILADQKLANPKVDALRKKAQKLEELEPKVKDEEIKSEKLAAERGLDTASLAAKAGVMFLVCTVGWMVTNLA